jgi:hypothetical protein
VTQRHTAGARRRSVTALAALVVLVLGGVVGLVATQRPPAGRELGRGLFLDPDQSVVALTTQLRHYRDLSVDSVTIAADLSFLCPGGTCDFDVLETAVSAARRAGMAVVLQVNRTPGSQDAHHAAYGPTTRAARESWVRAFSGLVGRFRTSVSYYEIWNEPDVDQFWLPQPDPAAYAALLHDAYLAAKQVDDQVQIVGGNFSANSIGFLGRMYDAMDARYGRYTSRKHHYYFDVLGVHPYTGGDGMAYAPTDATPRPEETSQGEVDRSFLGFRRMRALTASRERTAKPLALGEFGYRTDPGFHGPVPDAERARWLVDAFRLAADAGYVRYLTWYDHDTSEPGQQGFAIHGTSTEAALAHLPRS